MTGPCRPPPTPMLRLKPGYLTLIACLLVAACPRAAAESARPLLGLTLEQAIARLLPDRGAVLYSSDLVRPEMRVTAEPTAASPRARLEQILQPHGLRLIKGPGGSLLLVRAATAVRGERGVGARRLQAVARERPQPAIAEIIVNASQYELGLQPTTSQTAISGPELQSQPGLGDDTLRAVNRLPGTAASEVTAKGNIRGGEADETLVRYDGLRLYNPYHLRDFHSVFSTIDPGLVQRMDVSTGGYPVRFGSHMSGVVDIAGVRPAAQPYREISISFLNAAAIGSGALGEDTQWLLAARRSNLDLLLDLLEPRLGSPTYAEFHGRLAHRLDDAWELAGNLLVSDDDVKFNDGDNEEVADAEYRDIYAWLRADYSSAALNGSIVASWSDLEGERAGWVAQPGVSTGILLDQRSAHIAGLQTDWSLPLGERSLLALGGEWRHSSADYRYQDAVQFDLLFDTPGAAVEAQRQRDLSVSPGGSEYGIYANLRYELFDDLTLETGLRWDRETLTDVGHDSVSPRASLLYELSPATQLRASWGRFLQQQAVTELQIADGVTTFFRPQLAEHWIASVDHRFEADFRLRLEAYHKEYQRLRPRYENLLHTLILVPELMPDRIRIAPTGATAEGVELSLRSAADRPLSWWAGYTWSRVRDDVDGSAIARAWDQRHAVTAGVGWRGEHWEFGLAGGYRSGWPTTAVEATEGGPIVTVETAPRNSSRLGNSLSLDGRIARDFRFEGGESLTLFVEVSNLIDRENPCCVEFEVDPDSGDFEVEEVTYFRVLPSLGFIWRF